MGRERELFERLSESVGDGGEAAVLAAHVRQATGQACVVLMPRRAAWIVAAAQGVDLDGVRLRLQEDEIEGWLASATGHRPWSTQLITHGPACVARLSVAGAPVSAAVQEAAAMAAPFLAARRSRARSTETVHANVAEIVHDLGQPIASLSLAHEALAQAGRLDPVLLDRARRSVMRLRELTDDLLQLAHPHRRRVESVELVPLLKDLVAEHAERARTLSVRIDLEVRGNAALRGRRIAMWRAVGNVLSNAINFAPPGTSVQLRLDCGDPITIEVRDRGPGVSAALRERVFEPFFTTRPGGNGLGLAVARRVAEQHGGSVRFTDGPGGVVRFEFPRSRVVRRNASALAPLDRPAIL